MTLLLAWPGDDAAGARQYLASLIDLPEVREAIYVASPSLHATIAGWRAAPTSPSGLRIERALLKYITRMMGRATPFGLFSGVSVGRLGRQTSIELPPRAEYRRRTRLDNDYLFGLADELARLPEARATLHYRPNSSLYRVAGRLRYAVARVIGRDRTHELISIEPTDYLLAILGRAQTGARRDELANAIVDDDITVEDAAAFVDELIERQLLVPALGVQVTGPEPVDAMLQQLAVAELDGPRERLATTKTMLAALDATGLGNAPERYEAIASALGPLPGSVDTARLFQVDMVKPADATLATRVAADVARAIEQLAAITPARDPFRDFKRGFRERWDERAVDLGEVLDEEAGIGFEASAAPGSEGAPLLGGVRFGAAPTTGQTPWTRYHAHLLHRLTRALSEHTDEIVLDDSDFATMRADGPVRLPEAFAGLVRVAATAAQRAAGTATVLLESSSGPSGARLLGRFCHATPAIEQLVRAHLRREEEGRPGAVFAEIVHLAEGRIGNILCRPVLRSHEVVYLGLSGAPRERQLHVSDLLVSVRDDRVVLTSRSLGVEVIPRLSTAHNFRLRSVGVYRFLCALAEQDDGSLRWRWDALDSAPFLPRVRSGNVVLSRAMWNLDERDLAPLAEAVRTANKATANRRDVLDVVAALRRHRRLPRMLAISDGDNELPIDLDNPLLAGMFADELASARRARLVELFPAPDELVVTSPEGGFANEIVLTFTRPRSDHDGAHVAATSTPVAAAPVIAIPRELGPGSEWLYAKIYCGEATADRVLREAVGPVVRDAITRGDARRWFFIRYRDPAPHLRVRLAGDPAALLMNIVPALREALARLAADGAVTRLVLDTYVREIERYGGPHGIELVEQVFWHDSEAVLAIVELLDGDAGADARWRLALRGIESLLAALGLSAAERARVACSGRDGLGRELRADRGTWTSIGERFTRERADLDRVFAGARPHALEPGFALLARRDAAIADISARLRAFETRGDLAPGLLDMAWSLGHMHANRMLHAAQRAQELVIYDFLRRLHKARLARSAP